MLTAMRDGAKSKIVKFLLLSILALAVAGLVMTDMGGFFRSGTGQSYVAKVGGEKISPVIFDRKLRAALSGRGIDIPTAYRLGLVDYVLRNEINTILLLKSAATLGLRVSDDMVAKQIGIIIDPLLKEGMTKEEAFARVLRVQNTNEQGFILRARQELTTTLLKNAFELGTGFADTPEASALYKYDYETRTAEGLIVPYSLITDIPEPTQEDLENVYQKQRARYLVKEARTFSVALIDESILQTEIEVPEENIRAVYDTNIEQYELPERRQIKQAILTSEPLAAEVRALLPEKDMQDAVKSVTGETSGYTGSELYEKEGLPEEFAEMLFTASEGDVVGPVQSAFGWHVFIIESIKQPETESYEDVKDEIEKNLRQTQLDEELLVVANALDDRLASGLPLEDAMKEVELEIDVKSYGPVFSDGALRDDPEAFLEAFPEDLDYLLETVFSLFEGESSAVTQLSDGSYAVMRVDTVYDEQYKPFEEVKDELQDQWKEDRRTILAHKKAAELWQKINLEGLSIEEAAKSVGSDVTTYTLVRNEPTPKGLHNKAKQTVFDAKLDQYIVAPATQGYFVGQVTSIELPDQNENDEAELDNAKSQIISQSRQEYFNLYTSTLFQKYKVDVNRFLLEQQYGGDDSSY